MPQDYTELQPFPEYEIIPLEIKSRASASAKNAYLPSLEGPEGRNLSFVFLTFSISLLTQHFPKDDWAF